MSAILLKTMVYAQKYGLGLSFIKAFIISRIYMERMSTETIDSDFTDVTRSRIAVK